MLSAVNGYFDGEHVVLTENVAAKKGQKAVVYFINEETYVPADRGKLAEVSERLIRQNYEDYKELAK